MMRIERALPDHASELSRIAFESKKHWGYLAEWMEAWIDTLRISPEQIVSNTTFEALSGDQILGFYLLQTGSEKKSRLEHLWIRPARMGEGIGRQLFKHAVEQAAALGAKFIEIESDPHAEGFYCRLGAQRVRTVSGTVAGCAREIPVLHYDLNCFLSIMESNIRPD
jgi:GNAT superfamily N-acetyltransferase